ncbi:MAG TPA: glycogen debranching protein [Lachnospiraceae bacterium]|nr:glycogen debranching protein [Lachnospiraceae bacterium]
MKRLEGRPVPFGVTVQEKKVNFSIAVKEKYTCQLLLYRTGSSEPEAVYEMKAEDAIGEVRFLAVEGIQARNYEYQYRINGKAALDPYVKEVSGRGKFGQEEETALRGKIVSEGFDWEGDSRPGLPQEDVVAYNMHVRGFSMHSSSKVKKKGTFEGIVEKIPYLLELGINQIHCMPVYDFQEIVNGKINYWGYGPAFYFAPKASYAANGRSVKGLKNMVKACHKAGIEVVLNLPFDAAADPQLIVECLRYYMLEYHIDGFVLNPYVAPMESIRKDPLLKGVKIIKYEEGFQNAMRRYLKGDEGTIPEVMYWQKRLSEKDGLINYITNHTGFTLHDLVTYDVKHNEANGEKNQDGPDYNHSWNCGVEGPSRKKSIQELRRRQMKNALLLLFLSQGTPCLLAGDEFGNTQQGNNNVYCQDNEMAWLNWNMLKKDPEFFQFVKGLIAFRKGHPVLHQAKELLGSDLTGCGIPDISYHGKNAWQVTETHTQRELGILLSGAGVKDADCFIICNLHWMEHTFAIPALAKGKRWYRAISTTEGIMKEPVELGNKKEIPIGGRTIQVLIGK